MEKTSTIESSLTDRPLRSLDRFFDVAKKDTVIRLRWPLVILSSYLLYYSPSEWLTATQIQAVLILYLLSHSTLYFLADDLFDSPYFYAPLLLFDTIVLGVVLSTSGAASPDFYIACLLTVVLSVICNDARGLLMVTILAPLAYAYFVFNSAAYLDPNVYLRLPFPFVISLFYGYFAQVERIRRTARDNEEQITRQQKAAEEIRRQRERLEVLHQVNMSVASTIDRAEILSAFLETALIHLPYAAAVIRLRHAGVLETTAARGFKSKTLSNGKDSLAFTDRVLDDPAPLKVRNVFTDRQVSNLAFFEGEGLVSFLCVPLVANNEVLGCLLFLTREEHEFNPEEIDFISTLAGQAAIAIHHSELYDRSQRQSEELTDAHKIKDEFLKVVSTQLKTPLNVITGYSEMFLEGLLGEITPIQEKAIETVARQSKELHGLINTVLQVSSMEAEKLHVELHEINLWEFCSELRTFYDYPLATGVKLVWNYPADLPSIEGDRAKLRRMLENLVGNALKFTQQGTVMIAVRYLAGKQRLEFKISDTGVGIPEANIPKIFEKFRQGERHTGMEHGGVGLGLYIVKKYLDLLGGNIEVQSRVGEGTTFIFQIPAPLHGNAAGHEQLLLPTASENFGADSR
ncbi:MAG TPA: GAF domain-containing sensor histidine kinase [Candidatus Limnocylindrales bacterium]|nr:GAF domain-containing sensor histidine kinase [Candidatus Limnocylindrales bacterium]